MAEAKLDRFRSALVRGGTSRGLFLLQRDLPQQAKRRDELILSILGNPEPFQVNGVGGGTPWTSLVALLAEARQSEADVEVAFGRVIPGGSSIDYMTISGDLMAAAAQFAIDEGLVKASGRSTTVRMLDTATGQTAEVVVPVKGGKAQIEGRCLVDGVPGSGAGILVSFPKLGGGRDKLLPTGNAREGIATAYGEYIVTIVNALTPVVFINAESLGLTGTELPSQLECDGDLLDRVEAIRATSAEILGLVSNWAEAATMSPVKPRLVTVFESIDYTDSSGREISVMDIDLVCREATLGAFHYAFDLEVAVCTAVAAQIEGGVVFDALLREEAPKVLRIGHPAGVISVEIDAEKRDGDYFVKNVSSETTARRIMDGFVYLP